MKTKQIYKDSESLRMFSKMVAISLETILCFQFFFFPVQIRSYTIWYTFGTKVVFLGWIVTTNANLHCWKFQHINKITTKGKQIVNHYGRLINEFSVSVDVVSGDKWFQIT